VLVCGCTHIQTTWKNLDRLQRSIHVDSICLQSISDYIYARLQVLIIWANCFFSFNMSFLWRKVEYVMTISKLHTLTSVRMIHHTLRVPNKITASFMKKTSELIFAEFPDA